MNFACISVWSGDESLHSKCERCYIGMFLFSVVLYIQNYLPLLCYNSTVQFRWSIAPKFLAGLFCINYFSFELVGVFRIFQFVLVLVG